MKRFMSSLLSRRLGVVLMMGMVFGLAFGGYFGWASMNGRVQELSLETVEEEENEAPVAGDDPDGRTNWFMYQRMYPFNDIPEGARQAALDEVKRQGTANRPEGAGSTWVPIGPFPTTSAYQANGGFNSGRINAIAISPADSQLILIGSATGGIWRSTNGGTDFTPVSDTQADLGVGAISFAPSNPEIVYAAMGDVDNSFGYFGTGILKSTDSGATWIRINNTSFPGKGNSVAIQVDPIDADRVYVAQYNSLNPATGGFFSSGIYVSTNGGVAWTRTLTGLASDVVIHPTNRQILYAGMRFVNGAGELPGLYRSLDGGVTWARVYDSPYAATSTSTREFRVAVSRANPNRVYILFGTTATSPIQIRVERSDDGGETWTDNGVLANTSEGIDPGQFGYNTYLAVSPTNSNIVYVGTRDVFRSTNAGGTFTNINNSFATNGSYTPRSQKFHADQQSFAFQPGNGNIFYCGNDGGLWKTTNFGNTFTSLNATLSLTQFIGIAVHPTDSTKTYGGSQDNGSQRRTVGTGWIEYRGGDGGKTVVNPVQPSMVFDSYIRGSITRWLNDGTRYNGKVADLTSLGEPAAGARIAFYPPIVGNGVDGRLYVGTRRLLRCDNCDDPTKFIDNNGTRPTWRAPGGTFDQTRGGTDNLSVIAVAPSDSTVIYTGSRDGRAMVSGNGGETWNDITAGLPNRSIRSITVSAADPATVYVTVSGYSTGHIFYSTDAGANWTNISNNLPDIPTNAFLIDPQSATTLFAGTDIGVFRSTDSGASWAAFNNGLPPVPVMEFAKQPGGLIQIATYGRGAYELRPANTPTVNVGNATAAERGTSPGTTEGDGSVDFEISLSEPSTQSVTVTVSTNSVTANEGEDFAPVEDLRVVFPPNTLTQTVNIQLIEDAGDEPDETFTLEITGISNAAVGDDIGTGTITDDDAPPETPRNVEAVNITAQPGSQVTMAFVMDSLGDERSVSFTTNFDAAILSNPVVSLGNGVPSGSSLNTNTSQVGSGRIGISVAAPASFAAGSLQLVIVRFDIAANAPLGATAITFGTSPTGQVVLDSSGGSLPVAFVSGSVQVGSAASSLEISGRVLTPDEEFGIGITGARVTMVSPDGTRQTATTSAFGTYRFENVTRGLTYTLTVTAKRYRFAPRVLTVDDSNTDTDFVGLE